MIRQETLTLKQDELTRCITSRDSKLRELYHATVNFLRSARSQNQGLDAKYLDDGETSFLEANRLLDGRFFDPSTLPSLHGANFSQGLPYTKTRSPHSPRPSIDISRGTFYAEQRNTNHSPRSGHALEKPTEQVSATVLTPKDRASSQPQELCSTRISTAEESYPRNGDGGASSDQLKPAEDGPNVASKQVQTEITSLVDISLSNPLPTNLSLDKLPETSSTEDSICPLQTIPLTTVDVPVKPTAVLSNSATTRAPSSPGLVQSSTVHIELSGWNNVNHQGPIAGKGQASESPIEQATAMNEAPNQKLSSRDSVSVTTGDLSVQDTPKGSQSTSQSPNHVRPSTPRSPRNHFLDLAGKIHVETETQPGAVSSLQLGTPPLGSKFAGILTSPDEKLQLEGPQAIQHSKLSSNLIKNQNKLQNFIEHAELADSLPSQLVPGRSDEKDQNAAILVATDENDLGQIGRSSGKFGEQEQPPVKTMIGLGIGGNGSKELSLSRRPPMRIDTGVPTTEIQKTLSNRKTTPVSAASPFTQIGSPALNKSNPAAAQVQSPPERMTTRVSSGAIRHKSVSEILGETPKPVIADKSPPERGSNDFQREDTAIQSPNSASANMFPDPASFKQRLNELKGKERSKLSTVVFARQQPSNTLRYLDTSYMQNSDSSESDFQVKDYLLPLFAMQAAAAPISQPLHSLITSAHKTLSTTNHYTDFHEHQDCRMLERIYQLQSTSRWSLRQVQRSVEPIRPTSHWDVLIGHMKWMRTDFREERKWKIAAAKSIVDSCADWVRSSTKGRMAMQVKARHPQAKAEEKTLSVPTPELIPSTEDASSVTTGYDSPRLELSNRTAPAAIFSLPPEIFCFGVDKTLVTEKLLLELPLYEPSVDYEDAVAHVKSIAPDSSWRTPLVPMSKFVHGKIVSHEEGPPRKKSRYSYHDLDHSEPESTNRLLVQSEPFRDVMEPEKEDVALFNLENKHIRDRIHAGHAFRPPTEYIMPPQSFFESRHSSLWTQEEDDELRRLVREFSYNWSLISSCLSSPSRFTSEAERRTPWECFERWVSLEGLPAEMSKTQYFKAYQSRLQAAQKTIEAQQVMQQNQGNNTPHPPVRRRTTQPCTVDRRKNNKYIHLVDAMRKLAKKREAAIQKQQHVAGVAAMRKSNETVQPRRTMMTPQEFGKVKLDRELKHAEKVAEATKHYRIQNQQNKVPIGQKTNQQYGQPMHVSDVHSGRMSLSGSANGSSPSINSPLPNGQIQAGQINQARAIPALPKLVNGSQPNGAHSASLNGIPHASMQAHLPPIHQRLPPQMANDNLRIYQEANRVQEQQRYLHQRHQQHPQPNGQPGNSISPNMAHLNIISQTNPAILTSMQGRSSSPSKNGVSAPAGSSSSPQMTNHSQPQRLSSGVVPAINQIQNTLKNRNPQASPEQINKMTTETLDHYRVTQSSVTAAAMQAAAGPNNLSALSNNLNINLLSPPIQHQHQHQHQQQQHQHQQHQPHHQQHHQQHHQHHHQQHHQHQQHQQQQQPMLNGHSGSPMLNPLHYAQMLRTQQSQQSRNSTSINGVRTISRSATPQTHHRTGSAQGGPPPNQSPRPSQAQMAGGQ